MSNNSNSSKKSKNAKEQKSKGKGGKIKPLKLPKTSKPGKVGFKTKYRRFTSKQKTKVIVFKSQAKTELHDFYGKIVHQEVYGIDGKEPPKSSSFGKNFFGLYIIFIAYFFILIIPDNFLTRFLMFGNYFAFSNAIILFFIILSFLFSVDKIRIYIFEEKTFLKQLVLYVSLLAVLYIIFLVISTSINFMSYLLTLSMIWLILLSSRFYIYSRKFSTKIESQFIKKYSGFRFSLAAIIPFLILVVLIIISLFYRSFLVFLSLDLFGTDLFGPPDPVNAVKIYDLEMTVIMPLIYFSLIMTFVFIIFEFISTRRRAETKRAGTFDNFTFSLIVLFIFFFQILQISIFLFMQPETVEAIKKVFGGGTGSIISSIFGLEFVISLYFLYRIIKKTGKTLGWRILFFKKDGLILFTLACVFAQTLTRFTMANQIQNQGITTGIGEFLMADKYIISILMIFFLGTTLLIYYLKPHETSMFMRLQKETIGAEEESMERIYKIIRSEYLRRGEAYPLEILERELIKATHLSKGNVYSLVEQLAKKDMDILITEEKKKVGKPTKMIDFTSVTEKFDKKGVAAQKAKHFLSERLYETALKKEKKESRLLKSASKDQPEDSFISSLTADYSKKQVDKELFQQKLQGGTEISFADQSESLKNQIIRIIKKEYLFRIEKLKKNPEFFIPISEISNEIESATKVNPGELYPILEDLSKTDLELRLVNNPDEPEDKLITFLPFSDDNMNYSLANFRPEEYSKFRTMVTKNFLKYSKAKRDKKTIFQLKKGIIARTDSQAAWLNLLNILYKNYSLYSEQLSKIPNMKGLLKSLDVMIKDFEKREALKNSKT